jgi:excisionase family DNA binding protein
MKKEDPTLITVSEAAKIRGVGETAIRNLISRGRLQSQRLYGRILLKRAEVERFELDRPGPKKGAKKKRAAGPKKTVN